eukprot:7384770-Prymnesium_polylepis.1
MGKTISATAIPRLLGDLKKANGVELEPKLINFTDLKVRCLPVPLVPGPRSPVPVPVPIPTQGGPPLEAVVASPHRPCPRSPVPVPVPGPRPDPLP